MAYNPNNPNGQATMTNSEPVVIASDQSAVPVSGTFWQATQPISIAAAVAVTDNAGSLTVDNGGTFAVQAAQSGTWTIDSITTLPSITGTVTANAGTNLNTSALLTTTNFTDVFGTSSLLLTTQVDDIANTQDSLVVSSFLYGFDGSTWDRLKGDSTDGLLVNLGANNDVTVTGTVSAVQSGTWNITNISGTVSLPTGAATETTLTSLLTSAQLIDDTIIVLGTDTYTEATSKGQILAAVRRDADTTLVNTTNEYGPLQMDANGRLKVEAFSGETLPVSLTSTTITGTVAVTQSGTWDEVGINDSGNSITVDNGGTFAVQASMAPATSGGLSTYHLVSAGSTNATNIKASAGQVFGWFIYNSNSSARKVAFHNTAGTPTAGSSIFFSLVIPATSGANVEFTNGITFGTGIGITTVTGLADNDTAAVASNDLIINIFYK